MQASHYSALESHGPSWYLLVLTAPLEIHLSTNLNLTQSWTSQDAPDLVMSENARFHSAVELPSVL